MTTMISPVGDLMRIVGRAAEITGTYGHARTKPERIDAVTRAALVVEHVHQELTTFASFVYQRSQNGRLLHVLPDGQLARGVHTPWRGVSSTLTRSQQDRLRRWLATKAETRLRPPFVWSDSTRRWYVDLHRYPTVEAAIDWLTRHKMSGGEWLNLLP
jgi:hypothetical protein